jgi:hypothetical protein
LDEEKSKYDAQLLRTKKDVKYAKPRRKSNDAAAAAASYGRYSFFLSFPFFF